MKWELDTPVRVGGNVFAAIVEARVSVHATSRAMTANGDKRPLLFLLLNDDAVSGIDIDGKFYEAGEIARLYPTAIERLRAAKA